jgi:hypothetical protein
MPRRLGKQFLRPAAVERLLRLLDSRRPARTRRSSRSALDGPLAERVARVAAVELACTCTPNCKNGRCRLNVVPGDALQVDLAARRLRTAGEVFAARETENNLPSPESYGGGSTKTASADGSLRCAAHVDRQMHRSP